MGISIQDLLTLEYFKEFYVVAGRRGIHKEVQGVTVVDAPDAYRWSKGKELVLTSGYVLKMEPDTITNAFREGTIQNSSGLLIKRGRHLDRISEEMKALFDQYDIPLISMPFEIPYMEVMNQINIAIMNKTVQRFKISSKEMGQISDLTYKEQKIQRILRAVETDMSFPACIYDMGEEKAYYSSNHFKEITKSLNMSVTNYWDPVQAYTKYTLCDVINMSRYRLFNVDGIDGPRMSWILIPITTNDTVQAYFIVMESREFLDHYDEYAIRIAYLLLQALYEENMVTQSRGNIGFENFIQYMIHMDDLEIDKVRYQAGIQGISLSDSYFITMFRQNNPEISAQNERETFLKYIRKAFHHKKIKLVFLSENEGMIFIQTEEEEGIFDQICAGVHILHNYMVDNLSNMQLKYGMLNTPEQLMSIRDHINKLHNLMDMGSILFPGEEIIDYDRLGPLTWLQIPARELDEMLGQYRRLMDEEKNKELLRTLKIYLENNMNFSITAELMYVHVNTIRKRLTKLEGMLPLRFDQPLERMKLQILLNFLEL